ncbi:MAG: hypothetical protein JSV62_03865 [Promethearchaeota archaeon]|nr:MAG: hypothetical protein JSV62_03865 [Candidatus Lokiarchaeota archaeon]
MKELYSKSNLIKVLGNNLQLFDITHKFIEIKTSLFYDERTFREFIASTSFKRAEFIREGGSSIWVIRK